MSITPNILTIDQIREIFFAADFYQRQLSF